MNLLLKPIPYFGVILGVKNHLGVCKNFSSYIIIPYCIEESLKGFHVARLNLADFYHVRC